MLSSNSDKAWDFTTVGSKWIDSDRRHHLNSLLRPYQPANTNEPATTHQDTHNRSWWMTSGRTVKGKDDR